jgi:hypothetical protein
VDTLAFLRKVLPDGCFYFLDTPNPGGRGFKHHVFEDLPTMAARAIQLDTAGHTVYFACSGFREKSIEREITTDKGREKKQVGPRAAEREAGAKPSGSTSTSAPRSPGKPAKYATQEDAVRGLATFLATAKLPRPTIVSSGYGVHAYWTLTETVLPGQWKTTAEALKALTRTLSMCVDQTRTADEASVLRPVGTRNWKVRETPQPVRALFTADDVAPKDFADAVTNAVKLHKCAPRHAPRRQRLDLQPDDPHRAGRVSGVERQAHRRPLQPDQAAPGQGRQRLRAAVVPRDPSPRQVDRGRSGDPRVEPPYPGYSYEETQRKIVQIKSMGPTTCTVMEETNPDGCKGCPFKGRIASPIQLGVDIAEAKAPVVQQLVADNKTIDVVLPNPPQPFKRGDEKNPGLYMEIEPGVPVRFYPYDLFPIELAFDEQEKFMTAKVRHHLPLEGWAEFPFRASLVGSVKEFGAAMIDRGVFPENAKVMAIYMDSYLKLLQSKTKTRQLYNCDGLEGEQHAVPSRQAPLPPGRERSRRRACRAGSRRTRSTGSRSRGDLRSWQAGGELPRPAGCRAAPLRVPHGLRLAAADLHRLQGLRHEPAG